ncbi:hypothetical protein [Pseudomonas sp. CGJS7]|uniref:hypothetical protein n=1 Tax=Pseudomonas sp. CGJS7 TaxID=3109348 RepID=UPI003008BD39
MSQTAPATVDTAAQDASHLQILSIVYYVFAGLNALSIAMVLVLGPIMIGLLNAPQVQRSGSPPPQAFIIGVFVFIAATSLLGAVLHFMAARRLRQRRGMMFCQIIAALTCLSVPLGTVLGVFTFIVLERPSVKASFDAPR